MYSVRGSTGTMAGVVDNAISQLWNPHATQRIKVVAFSIGKSGGVGGGDFVLRRTSARGASPNNTVTPGIQNHSTRGVAPPSGVLMDNGNFGTQPTAVGVDLGFRWMSFAYQGSYSNYVIPGGIEVPPGSGLAIRQKTASGFAASAITWSWLEDW